VCKLNSIWNKCGVCKLNWLVILMSLQHHGISCVL